jgi:hypothetical protein
MSRNVSCSFDIKFLANSNSCTYGNENVLSPWVVGRWETLYQMVWSASNCRIDENIFFHVGKIHIHRIFTRGWTNSKCLYGRIYLIWHPQNWKVAQLLNIQFIKQYLY